MLIVGDIERGAVWIAIARAEEGRDGERKR